MPHQIDTRRRLDRLTQYEPAIRLAGKQLPQHAAPISEYHTA
jgi:hypothetical protein